MEQHHGSATAMHKAHPTYGQDMLMARVFHHMRIQLFTPTEESLARASLLRDVQVLEARQPDRFTARQLYFQELSKIAREGGLPGGLGGEAPNQALQRLLMKLHAARFHALPDNVKVGLAVMAAHARESRATADARNLACQGRTSFALAAD